MYIYIYIYFGVGCLMESIITITNLTIYTLRLGLGVNGGWALDGAPTKTPSPKVVGDLQWFLAFN